MYNEDRPHITDEACAECGLRVAEPRPPYLCRVCLGLDDPPPPPGGMISIDDTCAPRGSKYA